jgi:hypothetical protein
MTKLLPQSLSLISIEVGSVNTRAQFFDSVEGRYRFLAAGEAPSTIGAPAFDLNVGVFEAIEQLQEFTGRQFVTDRGLLISGDNEQGLGANAISTTFSGGPAIKVVTVGLLDEVSLDSVNKLVHASYCQVVETLSLSDRRRPESIVDAICQKLPELIVVAGGTNRGASRSVIRLANYLALALNLIPEKQRPQVLFVGNESLHEEIDNLLGALTKLHHSPNIRPNLDQESLGPAVQALNSIYFDIQSNKLKGLHELRDLAEGHILPAASSIGRVVRFLSTVIDAPKGMLGVDLGASSTTVASAFSGDLQLRVFPDLGTGRGMPGMIAETHLPQIMRWIPYDLSEDSVLDYLHNKPLLAGSLPTSPEELAIEQAAARQALRLAIGKSLPSFPQDAIYPLPGTLPWFDRILVSGSAIARAPRLEQSLLMILDAIQPVGIATIILDQNNLVNAIGAGAEIEPLLAVHVLESNSFINLGTVISPVGNTRGSDNPILRIQMVRDGQNDNVVEIRAGGITSIPLPLGRIADVYVQPLQSVNIGLGPGRGGWVRRVVGGVFGLIIDARGRPIQVPTSLNRRQEALQTWADSLTGS